jgi:hypothetical protein
MEESFLSIAPLLGAFVKPEGVQSVWRSFLHGKTSWSRPWALFVLNEWSRRAGSKA